MKKWYVNRWTAHHLKKNLNKLEEEGYTINHMQANIDSFGLQETLVVYYKEE